MEIQRAAVCCFYNEGLDNTEEEILDQILAEM